MSFQREQRMREHTFGLLTVCFVISLLTVAHAQTQNMQELPVDNGELAYEVRGDGEPVLFIHGATFAEAFRPLIVQPDLERFQLIHYHRRGYGASSSLEGPTSMEAQAADAAAVLRHLGVERAHVVGHSMGAAIAVRLAVDAPELVRSLALLEGGFPNPDAVAPNMDLVSPQSPFARYRAGEVDAVMSEFAASRPPGNAQALYESGDTLGALEAPAPRVFGSDWKAVVSARIPGGLEQAERDVRTSVWLEPPAVMYWNGGGELSLAALTDISHPTLFVYGSESNHFDPLTETDRIRSIIPQLEVGIIDGTNHLLQIENPKGVAEILTGFWARHPMADTVLEGEDRSR